MPIAKQRFTPPPIPASLIIARVLLPQALVGGALILHQSHQRAGNLALQVAVGLVASTAVLWLVAWLWVYPLYFEVSSHGLCIVWLLHRQLVTPRQVVAAAVLPRQRALDKYGESRLRLVGWRSERLRPLFTLGLLPHGYSLCPERVVFVRCRNQRPLLLFAQHADQLFQAVQGIIPLPAFAGER